MSFYPSFEKQLSLLDENQRKVLSLLPYLEDIAGWLLLEEAVELFSLAKSIQNPAPIIVEIGTWRGKSAYVFASAIKNTGGKLYCVDPFTGEGDEASSPAYNEEIGALHTSLFEDFTNTMKKYDLLSYIRPLRMISLRGREVFQEKGVDLLFIDGSHDYEAVLLDYKLWSPLIVPKGTIVFHDVGAKHVDGPRQVVEECLTPTNGWDNIRLVGEMVIATKI